MFPVIKKIKRVPKTFCHLLKMHLSASLIIYMTDSLYTVIVYFLIINVYVSLLKIVLTLCLITFIFQSGCKDNISFYKHQIFLKFILNRKWNAIQLSIAFNSKSGCKSNTTFYKHQIISNKFFRADLNRFSSLMP